MIDLAAHLPAELVHKWLAIVCDKCGADMGATDSEEPRVPKFLCKKCIEEILRALRALDAR
jgi:formylmethanofuran dehydrogenase subunit E